MKKVYTVVGFSDIVSVKGSWRVLCCVGEPFYNSHVGQNVEKVFTDISENIQIGDEVTLLRVGKNVAFVEKLS